MGNITITKDFWEDAYTRYEEDHFEHQLEGMNFQSRFENPSDEDLVWLSQAFHNSGIKEWFSGTFLRYVNKVSKTLFQPIMEGIIMDYKAQRDLGFHTCFVEPMIKHFGYREVNEYLIKVVETGETNRQMGAIRAVYWTRTPISYVVDGNLIYTPFDPLTHGLNPSNDGAMPATPESKNAHDALNDVWSRIGIVFLKLFVKSDEINLLQVYWV